MQGDGVILVCAALTGLAVGIWMGLMGGLLTSNYDILEECRKQHNVYECTVIAIPKDKEGIYK